MIRRTLSLLAAALLLPVCAQAQNISSQGQTWATGWNFGSATDRSVALSRAQIMKQVETGPADTIVTYNTYNDSRSNYVETVTGDGGTTTTDLHVGDEIGENTYAVGSLNTGSNTIEVNGSGNTISAENSANTSAPVDGSISSGDCVTGGWAPVLAGSQVSLGDPQAAPAYLAVTPVAPVCR